MNTSKQRKKEAHCCCCCSDASVTRQYLARLTHTRDYLDEIVASSSEALTQLSELTDSFTSVVGETQALSRQSRTYIDAMERGQRLAAEVQDALSWYDKYDGLARKINMPNVLK